MEEGNLHDLCQDEELSAVWAEKAEFYAQMKAAQEEEFKEYGYLRQFADGPLEN